MIKSRILYLIKLYFPILIIGTIYYIICLVTPFRIPCIFRSITGYKCPGCGITDLFLFTLKGDFISAFECNPMVFIIIPIIGIIFIRQNTLYIKYGYFKMSNIENLILYLLVILLLLFCIIRNIYSF